MAVSLSIFFPLQRALRLKKWLLEFIFNTMLTFASRHKRLKFKELSDGNENVIYMVNLRPSKLFRNFSNSLNQSNVDKESPGVEVLETANLSSATERKIGRCFHVVHKM